MTASRFEQDGFAIVDGVLSEQECRETAARLALEDGRGGSRSLLDQAWCRELGRKLRSHPALSAIVPPDHVAVQCTFFEKSARRNWLVPIHQDLSIPVADRVDDPALRGWSTKEGKLFVQAPVDVLERMIALRLHLDPCGAADGPLRVVPGSHVHGLLDPEEANALRDHAGEAGCVAPAGAVLALRPLLLHASSKAAGSGTRRILHFVFGPPGLPSGLAWAKKARD